MDPELRAYLEAMEGRLATKADLDGLRQDVGALRDEVAAQRAETVGLHDEVAAQRAEMTAQRADTVGLHDGMARLRAEMAEQFTAVRADTAKQFLLLRGEMAEQYTELRRDVHAVRDAVEGAEGRLDRSIRGWKEESSLALRRIDRLTGRVGRLTRRVRLLEQGER